MFVKSLFLIIIYGVYAISGAADTVPTKNGPIIGDSYLLHREFLGIPFGKAPVGELRFASPQPFPPWAPNSINATQIGNACPGTIQTLFDILPGYKISEDCLFLNIYTPTRARISKPLPVLFWIYGGAFILGDGHELGLYDGSHIVQSHDVIVVTSNYRLGPFGFLVVEGEATGNYGLEDQRLAMKWVIDHIANFGGDPQQITIFGESAGAMSIGSHLTSPLSAGLFQRAILQSNAIGLQFLTRSQALEVSSKLSRLVGCETGDISCLRQLDWQKIAWKHLPIFPTGIEHLIGDILTWAPTIDDKNLFKDPIDAFAAGEFNDVPTIWGSNKDEMTLFQGLIESGLDGLGLLIGRNLTIDIGPVAYNLMIGVLFRDKADLVRKQYPPSFRENNFPLLAKVLSEYVFICSSRFGALKMSSFGKSEVRTYEFGHVPKWSPLLERLNRQCFVDRVCHAMELPYVFHPKRVSVIPISPNFTPEEEKMSQEIIDYWVGFASGNVNGGENPPAQWEPFSQGKQNLLAISTSTKATFWDSKVCDFWDTIGYVY